MVASTFTSCGAASDRDLARKGQQSDRYTAAVGQLGSDTLETRLGGIYALEQLGTESTTYYLPAYEVIAAYVRSRFTLTSVGCDSRRPQSPPPAPQTPLDFDLFTAVEVLGRRGADESYVPDLSGICLSYAPLINATMRRINLARANLVSVDLTGANLTRVELSYAEMTSANLANTDLTWSNLHGANLAGAKMANAGLRGAQLTMAWLFSVDLTDADLTNADLTGANLDGANLTGANLTGADLSHANLTTATRVDRVQWPRDFTPPR
ncbi:hypothetical protein GOALK_120_00210 [Gordonia alkanivorans NBRC 16433]|uniref:Pentapeptide repeat-containing protein n=1 Tax=Gordonia alkanivorans NBRC 16433 TaxID=1027371 RepID=F9W275_9ACTN|nr:hypothetical protein GOALK_120_00210 [Gordonia alkanivorans NBRC 16433]